MSSPASPARHWLWLVLGLALVRGGLYATLLPPWGVIDEEQHLHIIQYLAEQHAYPVVGQVYLSPEIARSLIATHRWEIVLGVPGQYPPDPREWGLEGYSYQAYHPPLYYLLLAPLYGLLPDDILLKLAGLRWATVLLSVVTVWLTYRAARELFPAEPWLPLATALLLVCLPERTAAVSRVNNDALLELAGAAWFWLTVRVWRRGLTTRASQGLGLILGLGLLAKLSFAPAAVALPWLWWRHRRTPRLAGHLAWTAGLAAGLAGPWLARNLLLYGDPTGYAAFRALLALPAPAVNAAAVGGVLLGLWRNTWLVWWQGAGVGSRPLVEAVYAAWAVLSAAGLWGLVRRWRQSPADRGLVGLLVVSIGAAAALALSSFFSAQVPFLQGRFLLGVLGLVVALWCAGFWRAPGGAGLWAAAVALWLAADALQLFVNLLPQHYYASAFLGGARPALDLARQWPEAWALFLSRWLSDKPAGAAVVALVLLSGYVPLVAGVGALLWTALRRRPAEAQP